MKSKKTLLIRLLALVIVVGIAVAMMIIGRGHTLYLDNKTLDYGGKTYETPYKVEAYYKGEQFAKLYKRERGMVTCMGGKVTVDLVITQEKGGDETTQTITIDLPWDMDGVIINLPAYLSGLPVEAYRTEFIPTPVVEEEEEPVPGEEGMPGEEGVPGGEDMGLGDI